MSIVEIKIPSPGESISTVELYKWLVEDGAVVKQDMEIAELESDKATLMLTAVEAGKISFKVKEGDTVEVGAVACTIDTSVQPEESEAEGQTKGETETKAEDQSAQTKTKEESKPETPVSKSETTGFEQQVSSREYDKVKTTPLAKKVMEENALSVDDVISGLKRLRSEDILAAKDQPAKVTTSEFKKEALRESKTERLSTFRRKLSERLVSVKNETAMLTTFNEVDMKPIMDIRKKYQQDFIQTHGIKLGMMSFFMKASSVALLEFPNVNSIIDGENLITYEYTDISVAVSAEKGLMVPVVRNVESLGLAEIERAIAEVADKARENKLSIPEMSGGTFTITNGGIFGSMLSTPLINPPQSAILGMHNINERPVAIDGQVVIKPMMYVALSYDHRVIDGKDSVSFLKRIKHLLENPIDLLYGNSSADKSLLEI